jgi:hypothetical protein
MLHLKKENALNLQIWPVACCKWLLISYLCCQSLFAQRYGSIKQQFKAGSSEDNAACAILSDNTGTIYLAATVYAAGNQVSEHFGNGDIWIAALSPDGNLLWNKSLGGSYSDIPGAMKLSQGILHVVGSTGSFLSREEAGDRQRNGDAFYIALAKEDGRIESYNTFGGTESDFASLIAVSEDNKLIWGGHTFSNLNLDNTSGSGSNIWLKYQDTLINKGFTAGGNADEFPIGLTWAGSQQWVLLAQSPQNPNGICPVYKPWLMSFNDSLKSRKSILPNTQFAGRLHHGIRNQDGSFCLVGSTLSTEQNPDFWWMKLSAEGEILAEKSWGGSGTEVLHRIAQCKDGGWIMTGWSTYYQLETPDIKGGDDAWVMRMDPEGNVEWYKTLGGPNNERGVDVMEYLPGVFYMVADKQVSDASDKRTLWIVRLEEEECDVPDLNPKWKVHGPSVFVGQYIQFSAGTEERISCVWDFGDGTTSKEPNPMKKYYRKGNYEVTLTVKGSGDCNKIIKLTDSIQVN